MIALYDDDHEDETYTRTDVWFTSQPETFVLTAYKEPEIDVVILPEGKNRGPQFNNKKGGRRRFKSSNE